VAWADNPGADLSTVQQVYYARSVDGASFEQPRRVSEGVDEGIRAKEIRVVSGANGLVVVAWWAVVPGANGNEFLTAFVARSRDGGEQFEPAAETSMRFRVLRFKEGFSNSTSLSLALSEMGDVYLLGTVQDYPHGFNVYFARSLDDGTFARPVRVSSYARVLPRATANALGVLPSGDIWAGWTEAHGDFFNEIKDVYAATSRDGGRTFTAPQRVTGISGVVGALVSVGNKALLLSQIQKKERSLPATFVHTSSNGGASFSKKVKLGRVGANSHHAQHSIVTDGAQLVAVAWTENTSARGPAEGIYAAVSTDGGRTFGTAEMVVPGLFPERPALVLGPGGALGLVYTSSAAQLGERDVLFRWLVAPAR
jgi:hypothetical protein